MLSFDRAQVDTEPVDVSAGRCAGCSPTINSNPLPRRRRAHSARQTLLAFIFVALLICRSAARSTLTPAEAPRASGVELASLDQSGGVR